MTEFIHVKQAMPQPTFEGLVQLPGVSLFVRQFGIAGPPVILIHGGPDWDQSYFFPFLAPLARSCRLIAFDLRGCGRSQKFGDPQHYHIDLVVEDLAQLLAFLQLEHAILLGFSYGGRVALRFLDRYPAKVSKLILASSTAYDHVADALEQWDEYQSRYTQSLREQVSAIWCASSPSPEQRTRQLAELTLPLNIYHLELLPMARQVIDQIDFSGEWMQAWQEEKLRGVQHIDYAQRLAELGIPLLILHGEKDMVFPIAVAKRLAEQVPGALLTILPQTSHFAHIEATEAWNTAILRFLFNSAESFEAKSGPEMSGDAVVQLLQLFEQHGIEVVVDGGWGVDALLSQQTRAHNDLDIALEHKDVLKLRALLQAQGYRDVLRDDTRDCNFVMGDDQGHEVDFHSYIFDANGKLVFGVPYPLESLTGTGSIQGYPVKCIPAEWMVKFHSGYELDENDYRDVAALCERFGIALPDEYERFKTMEEREV